MDIREKMFDMGRGRWIEDRAKEGRIEYRDRGLRRQYTLNPTNTLHSTNRVKSPAFFPFLDSLKIPCIKQTNLRPVLGFNELQVLGQNSVCICI